MNEPTSNADAPAAPSREPNWSRRIAVALFLLLVVAVGSTLRIHTTLNDANFDPEDARSLLKSDPGLLYYITERIVDAGGLAPADFRADTRIEHPGVSDIPAMFSVGQEFVVAWGFLLFGDGVPLHMVALWLMSICASLAVLGVFGLGYELSGRRIGWGILAALLYLVLQGNYRTIGFILIREDFSIPWLSLHLYLLARCLRVKSRGSVAWAAILFVLAASTWHAMGFMLTIEAAVVLAWFMRTGENPMAHRNAWIMPAIVAPACLVVPVLRAKGFLVSLPMLIMISLWIAAACQRAGKLSAKMVRLSAPAALLALVPGVGLVGKLFGVGRADLSHVFELMKAKVMHLGQLPADPTTISFDTRLLWQGPFSTPDWTYFHGAFGAALVVLALCVLWGGYGWVRARGDSRVLGLMAIVVGGAVAALLVRRTVVLPALLVPVVAVVALAHLRSVPARGVLVVLFLAYQLPGFSTWIRTYQCPWYIPPEQGQELAEVLQWVESNLPDDEPICSDLLTGTAILAHCGNPMLVQPKYETTSSRRRIETFMDEFMNGTVPEFRTLLIENDCRYVLTNQEYWRSNAYAAGIQPKPGQKPDPKTPYFNFCHPDLRIPQNLAGFTLVFTSPTRLGKGRMRVFRMVEPAGG